VASRFLLEGAPDETPLSAVRVFPARSDTACAGHARSRPLSILKSGAPTITSVRATL